MVCMSIFSFNPGSESHTNQIWNSIFMQFMLFMLTMSRLYLYLYDMKILHECLYRIFCLKRMKYLPNNCQ